MDDDLVVVAGGLDNLSFHSFESAADYFYLKARGEVGFHERDGEVGLAEHEFEGLDFGIGDGGYGFMSVDEVS